MSRSTLSSADNQNLFAALRAAFPSNLDAIAVETDTGLQYSWRDLDRATAMIANLLASLDLPEGSRIAVQVEKSVEAMLLYLATLRAGYVYLPLNTAYQSAEIEYFIGNAEPAVMVCTSRNFSWVSKIAFRAGTRHVFTLGGDRTGSLLERAAALPGGGDRHTVAQKSADDLAVIIYTSGTTGRSKGAMLTHGNMLSNAMVLKDYWGWRPDDVLIHALPIFHVHGLFVAIHGALLSGAKMIWLGKFDAKQVVARLPQATVFMGVPTLYVRMLAEPALSREAARGYVTIVGRAKDLIISGGYNVYPAEIESFINELPGVAESAVVGVPHPDFGEVGVAIVVPKPGQTVEPDRIMARLKDSLANFKIPKHCFVASELPRNAMGKVQKKVLRAQHRDLFARA